MDTEVRVRGCIVDTDAKKPGELQLVNVGEDGKYGKNETVDVQPPDFLAGYVYRPVVGDDPPRAVFVIDTMAYQTVIRDEDTGVVTTQNKDTCDTELYGTANKIRVTGG